MNTVTFHPSLPAMRNRLCFLLPTLFIFVAASLYAAEGIDGARAEVYKTIGERKLKIYLFENDSGPQTNRSAIVFFFGGGWTTGSPKQFAPQCRYFASRGMVAISADYRVKSRDNVKPTECVRDAKSCIRWVRAHAASLGIDSHRIVAAGGSAGGHLAAATATLPGWDEPGEDLNVSAAPNALVLFNPALVLAPFNGLDLSGFETKISQDRLGCDPRALSPAHHIRPGLPPTIIFHGKTDTTVPYITSEAFAEAMKKAANRCELIGYDGQQHGFFNYDHADGRYYHETLAAADTFLVSIGFLCPR